MTLGPLSDVQVAELVRHVFREVDIVSCEPASDDDGNWGYRLHLSNQIDTVVKVYGGQRESIEIRLLSMVTSETGVPVPRVLYSAEHLSDQDAASPHPHPWAVLTQLPGQPLNELMGSLDDGELEAVSYEMGRYLAHLHQIPVDEFGTLFADGPCNHVQEDAYVGCQGGVWLDSCNEQGLLTTGEIGELRALLGRSDLLRRKRACLVHGGFRARSVSVERGATGYHVTGFLGFTRAQGGSPELDMGILLAWDLGDAPASQRAVLDGYTEVGVLPAGFWERLALYQALAGLERLLVAHARADPQLDRLSRGLLSDCLSGPRGTTRG